MRQLGAAQLAGARALSCGKQRHALRPQPWAASTHPVRLLEVLHRRALRQELGVGQDLELHGGVGAVAPQHLRGGCRAPGAQAGLAGCLGRPLLFAY